MIKFALHQYLPKRYLKTASFEDIDRHRMILDFKDGKPYATRWAAKEICNSLSAMDLTNTIVVCVPACCKRTNDRRFKEFSSIICERTGAVTGSAMCRCSDTAARHTSTMCMSWQTTQTNTSMWTGISSVVER